MDGVELPRFLLSSIDSDDSQAEMHSLEEVARAVVKRLAQSAGAPELGMHGAGVRLHRQVRLALDFCADQGASEGQALLLLASWTNSRIEGIGCEFITSRLQRHLKDLDAKLRDSCVVFFEAFLGGYAIDRWSAPPRASRDAS